MTEIVASHFWNCEFCNIVYYDQKDIIEHLKTKHQIDFDSPDAHWGLAGDNIVISDLAIPHTILARIDRNNRDAKIKYDFDKLLDLLENLKGVEAREDYHPEKDTFNHSLQTLHHSMHESNDIELILAAMMHDIGKAVSKPDHEKVAVEMLQGLLTEKSLWLIENHMRVWYLIDGKMARIQKIKDLVSNKWFPDLVLLGRWDKMSRKADFPGRYDRDKIKARLELIEGGD